MTLCTRLLFRVILFTGSCGLCFVNITFLQGEGHHFGTETNVYSQDSFAFAVVHLRTGWISICPPSYGRTPRKRTSYAQVPAEPAATSTRVWAETYELPSSAANCHHANRPRTGMKFHGHVCAGIHHKNPSMAIKQIDQRVVIGSSCTMVASDVSLMSHPSGATPIGREQQKKALNHQRSFMGAEAISQSTSGSQLWFNLSRPHRLCWPVLLSGFQPARSPHCYITGLKLI